jgi:dimethylargininase
MTAPLRRVVLREPATAGDFRGAGWREPERGLLRSQHAAFAELLASLGVDVTVLPASDALVDACFVYDPVLVTDTGQIVLRMAKGARAAEPELLSAALEELGVPVAASLEGTAVADGGDMLWLDEATLAVGRGYRTNAEAHRQLAAVLARDGVEPRRFDLPHDRGPGHVLHLLSVVSPVAEDLAAVFEPLAPVSLLEELDERGIARVRIDADEVGSQGCNVLAVRPGVVVLADGNPRARRALEGAGCEVHVYAASELNKGDGGPTCLTRPVLRG